MPIWHCCGSCRWICEPWISMNVPNSSVARRVRSSTCATAAMDASASPRNPIVVSENKSVDCWIFDVACRSNARRASVALMPFPLSMTCMDVRPAPLIMTFIMVASASIEFSTSSFTTDAGRCITSPAAIWLATESGRR